MLGEYNIQVSVCLLKSTLINGKLWKETSHLSVKYWKFENLELSVTAYVDASNIIFPFINSGGRWGGEGMTSSNAHLAEGTKLIWTQL